MNLKHNVRIATWNVQTLLRQRSATILSYELSRYNTSIAGLCESRWPGSGECSAADHTFIWSGPTDGRGLYGVALVMPHHIRNSLVSWSPVSDRILTARFLHRDGKMTIIVAYAPTDVTDDPAKDAFFDKLHQVVQNAPPHDITVILTDANVTVSYSSRSDETKSTIGTSFVDACTNDNGRRPLNLCGLNDLSMVDTWFLRKKIHQWTWYSPDGRTRKALDHIIVARRWRSFVTNARVHRGAQLGNTDHHMLVGTYKLKLKLSRPAQNSRPLDSFRLKDPAIASAYKCSISNKFNALADTARSDWKHFAEEVTQSVACTARPIRH